MDIETLPDDELARRARDWRSRALHGERDARDVAHRLESELRRRAGAPEIIATPPYVRSLNVPLVTKPWWKIWRLR